MRCACPVTHGVAVLRLLADTVVVIVCAVTCGADNTSYPVQANSGLVPPATATYLLGKGGAILIVLMLFMAVTSSGEP
jgi:Na+/proline symporter